MSASYRFVVTGRVQGVGFRAATRRRALALELWGWVRNRADGAVEGLAGGAPGRLEDFRRWLHEGPALARVECVDWQLDSRSGPLKGFDVAD